MCDVPVDLLRHQSSRTMKQPSAPLFAGAPAYGGQPVQGGVIQGARAYGGQPVQGAVIQGQPVVVQPQVIQGAVVQGSVVQQPQMVPNQYVVQQPQIVNPASVQIHGVAGVQSVAPPLGPRQPFQSGTFDCFDDFLGCCCVFWFQPCVVCCEGEQCGVGAELGLRETHVGLGPFCVVCLSNLSIYGFPPLEEDHAEADDVLRVRHEPLCQRVEVGLSCDILDRHDRNEYQRFVARDDVAWGDLYCGEITMTDGYRKTNI